MGIFSGLTNQETEEVFIGADFGESVENTEEQNEGAKIITKNIIFVGKREVLSKQSGEMETIEIEAPRIVSDGDKLIELPPDEEQKAGFYSADAVALVSLFPADYKLIMPKG